VARPRRLDRRAGNARADNCRDLFSATEENRFLSCATLRRTCRRPFRIGEFLEGSRFLTSTALCRWIIESEGPVELAGPSFFALRKMSPVGASVPRSEPKQLSLQRVAGESVSAMPGMSVVELEVS